MTRIEPRRRLRKSVIIASWLFFAISVAFGQQSATHSKFVQITAGLGVSAHSDPSIVDYINQLAAISPDQQLSHFASASEFFITPELQITDDWSLALEYSYMVKSYSVSGFTQWDFSYTTQMPTLIAHYLLSGEGYLLKFGGGVGYAFGNMSEQLVSTGTSESRSASGPSIKVEAVGNTEFDEHFWGSIGVDLRGVFAGSLKNSTISVVPAPKLNFFSAGIKFGVTYQF